MRVRRRTYNWKLRCQVAASSAVQDISCTTATELAGCFLLHGWTLRLRCCALHWGWQALYTKWSMQFWSAAANLADQACAAPSQSRARHREGPKAVVNSSDALSRLRVASRISKVCASHSISGRCQQLAGHAVWTDESCGSKAFVVFGHDQARLSGDVRRCAVAVRVRH